MKFSDVSVLVVDDNTGVRTMLLRTLEVLGFVDPGHASSADEAQKMFGGGLEVDLLLSDVRMDGKIDGYSLAKWVREQQPKTAILLLTGYTDHEIYEFDVLPKPYTLAALEQSIERVLRL